MKIPATLIISTFLSWAAFDLNLFRRRGDLHVYSEDEISLDLGADALHQKKRIKQHRLNVIPIRYRGIRRPVRSKCNYFSTKSRDVRDSDQMKIRRKFNNM